MSNRSSFRSVLRAFAIISFSVVMVMGVLIWFLTREPSIGGDFQLTYKGEPWIFSEHKKPLNVLYMGYAKCPDVCPMTMGVSSHAFKQLTREEQERVQFLFLSVDYEHDQPEDVARYAQQFFPDFIGLSGSAEQVNATVELFGANYMVEKNPKSYMGYSIIHTDRLFILNSKGVVLTTILNPRSTDLILKTIKEYL